MKKVLVSLIAVSVLTGICFSGVTNWPINGRPTSDWFSASDTPLNIPLQWMRAIDPLVASVVPGTGKFFYVDTNITKEGDGSSWTNAKKTLQKAIDLCADNNGDVIYIAQGSSESVTSSGTITIDCAGITIIGCGAGDQRPTYTAGTAATAKILVTADDVYIYNCIFQSGKNDLETVFLVTADDFTIDSCTLRDSTSGLGMITIGAANGDSDRFCVKNCQFYQPGTTNDHSIEILFDMVGGRILNNIFFGDYDEGAIAIPADGDACLNLMIIGNVVYNKLTSGLGIDITNENSTGICANNHIFVDTYANGLDPGGLMDGGGNIISTAVNLAGISALPAPAIGTVTAGSAEDILKKLYYTADGTVAYPQTVANDSTIAKILSKSDPATSSSYNNATDSLEAISEAIGLLGVADVGEYADEVVTHMDANSTVVSSKIGAIADEAVTHIDANSTVVSSKIGAIADEAVAHIDANSTTIAAIKAVTDDLAGISQIGDKVQADIDVNSFLYWQPRAVQAQADEFTQNLFNVAGGPIEILSFWGYVDVVIGGNATSCKIWLDALAGPTYDQDFSTSVAITSDPVGTMYVFSAANPAGLTPLEPGSNGAGNPMYPWICQPGLIKQLMDADPGGLDGDHITWTMVWRPLKAEITVAPQ